MTKCHLPIIALPSSIDDSQRIVTAFQWTGYYLDEAREHYVLGQYVSKIADLLQEKLLNVNRCDSFSPVLVDPIRTKFKKSLSLHIIMCVGVEARMTLKQ